MNKYIKSIFSVLFFVPSVLFAQNEEEGNPGLTQEVITFGNRQIKLRDAYRIGSQPQLFDTLITKTNVKYEVKSVLSKTKYEVQPIQAANLRIVEPLSKLYRVYARGGVGMYTSPIGDLHINSLRSRTGGLGLSLNHYSSAGGVKDVVSNGAFSSNKGQLWGKSFIGKHGLSGSVDYSRDVLHLYGYQKDRVFTEGPGALDEDSLKQRYQSIGGSVKLESYFDNNKKLNHAEEFSYYNFSNQLNTMEQNFKGSILFNKMVNKETFALVVKADHNQLSRGDSIKVKANNTILQFSPQVSTLGETYKLKLGLQIFAQLDSTTKFYFFPDAEFSFELVPSVIMPYAGLGGGVNRNSFRSTFRSNPFISDQIVLQNSIEKYRVYGGIRGNASASMSFNIMAAQAQIDNYQLFTGDTAHLRNAYNAVYDKMNKTTLMAELSFHRSQKLELLVKGEYFIYSMGRELRALNLPNAKVTIAGKYNMYDKFYITTDLFVESNRFARETDETNTEKLVNLGKVIDVNLGFEYRYTKRLSAFVNFNNIANQKYQRFYGYQVQGMSVFGGFTFAF